MLRPYSVWLAKGKSQLIGSEISGGIENQNWTAGFAPV